MGQKSVKYRAVNTLITNIPICLAICLTAQLLSIGKIVLALTCMNFALAYVVSFLVGMFLPLVPWGLGFAGKCKAKPDSLKFGLLVNVIVNTGYVVVNSIVLTSFNVCILGGQPVFPVLFIAMATTIIPIWIVGYIVSFIWTQPAMKISSAICKE